MASLPCWKTVPARHVAADERNASVQRLRPLLQIFGNLLAAKIDLIRHGVFREDIGEAFHFAGGGREEGQAAAGFEQRFGLANSHLQVAVEGHRRPRRDVKNAVAGLSGNVAQFEMPRFENATRCRERAELVPLQHRRRRIPHPRRKRFPATGSTGDRRGFGQFRFVDEDQRLVEELENGSVARTHGARQ